MASPSAHAKLGPSDSARWMSCPGSIQLTEQLKATRESTTWSAEGTFAHMIREEVLDIGFDARDFIGHRARIDGFPFEWREEDAKYLQPGLDRIRQFHGKLFLETKVSLARWAEDCWGTLDVGIVGKNFICINDLKWGQGVPVEVVGNTQLRIYALGFWWNIARHLTDAKEVILIIDQPRMKRQQNVGNVEFEDLDAEDDEPLQQLGGNEWRVSVKDLLEFGNEVKAAARRTTIPGAPRIPSAKACRWCPAAKIDGMCPEFEKHNMQTIGLSFENLDTVGSLGLDVKPSDRITPERRTYLIRNWPTIERWYKRMHAQALIDALAGDFDKVPGLKAVEGRHGKRDWIDEETAEAFLVDRLGEEKAYVRKLLSPAQAEKLLPTDEAAKIQVKPGKRSALVKQGDPKPVLVDKSDRKQALVDREVKFDNLDDDENVEND